MSTEKEARTGTENKSLSPCQKKKKKERNCSNVALVKINLHIKQFHCNDMINYNQNISPTKKLPHIWEQKHIWTAFVKNMQKRSACNPCNGSLVVPEEVFSSEVVGANTFERDEMIMQNEQRCMAHAQTLCVGYFWQNLYMNQVNKPSKLCSEVRLFGLHGYSNSASRSWMGRWYRHVPST